MAELKLPRLPDRVPVKLTVLVSPQLHVDLIRYAEIYCEAYGQKEAITDLVPAMLSSFLESDREFARSQKGGSAKV